MQLHFQRWRCYYTVLILGVALCYLPVIAYGEDSADVRGGFFEEEDSGFFSR